MCWILSTILGQVLFNYHYSYAHLLRQETEAQKGLNCQELTAGKSTRPNSIKSEVSIFYSWWNLAFLKIVVLSMTMKSYSFLSPQRHLPAFFQKFYCFASPLGLCAISGSNFIRCSKGARFTFPSSICLEKWIFIQFNWIGVGLMWDFCSIPYDSIW